MKRAKQAGLGGKDNWSKYPRQMLRARVLSEGIRATFPGCNTGFYTPEEVQDFEPINVTPPRTEKPHTEPPPAESLATDATGSEADKKTRPLLLSQAKKIFEVAAALETPLNKTEAIEVIDWYCASNEHGGRTYEAGQALIFGFETIFNRYLDEVKFAGQNNEDDR